MAPSKSKKSRPETASEAGVPDSGELPPDRPEEEPTAEVARLREEVERLQDALARAQAELLNQQKRHERERETAARYRVEPLARELLEILDAMEEAGQAMARQENLPQALGEGQALTLRNMLRLFEKFSVEVIDPKGEVFDPKLHEAVAMQPAGEAEPGSVLEVFRKGYRLHDRLLRPARVVVAAQPQPEPADGGREEAGPGPAGPT